MMGSVETTLDMIHPPLNSTAHLFSVQKQQGVTQPNIGVNPSNADHPVNYGIKMQTP